MLKTLGETVKNFINQNYVVTMKSVIIFSVLLIIAFCIFRIVTLENTPRNMIHPIGWTDSQYIHDGQIDLDAPLSQWPFSHDIYVQKIFSGIFIIYPTSTFYDYWICILSEIFMNYALDVILLFCCVLFLIIFPIRFFLSVKSFILILIYSWLPGAFCVWTTYHLWWIIYQ